MLSSPDTPLAAAESGPAALQRRSLLKMCAAAFATGMFAFRAVEALGETAGMQPVSVGQTALLSAIADTILPDTDTPGAVKAGVVDFMTLMISGWLDPAESARFLSGLDEFGSEAKRATGQSFTALPPSARLAHLKIVQAAAGPLRSGHGPVPFFLMVKRLTVFGYYTSEIGAATELTFNLVPGAYDPCAKVDHAEHAFSISRLSPIFPLTNSAPF